MKTIVLISIFLVVNGKLIFAQEPVSRMMPMIGDNAPLFSAESTNGEVTFPSDFGNKWKILFSHPADFTPVCSSELLELAAMQPEFDKIGVRLAVVSTDQLETHKSWKKSLESIAYPGKDAVKIKYPLIEDPSKNIARLYGMLQNNSNSSKDVRGVYVIDPDDKIAAIFFYPLSIGRNTDEILRTLKALQTSYKYNVLTPANWNPGSDVLLPYLSSNQGIDASNPMDKQDTYQLSWYMWFKKMK